MPFCLLQLIILWFEIARDTRPALFVGKSKANGIFFSLVLYFISSSTRLARALVAIWFENLCPTFLSYCVKIFDNAVDEMMAQMEGTGSCSPPSPPPSLSVSVRRARAFGSLLGTGQFFSCVSGSRWPAGGASQSPLASACRMKQCLHIGLTAWFSRGTANLATASAQRSLSALVQSADRAGGRLLPSRRGRSQRVAPNEWAVCVCVCVCALGRVRELAAGRQLAAARNPFVPRTGFAWTDAPLPSPATVQPDRRRHV